MTYRRLPKELRGFIPEDDDKPPFYHHVRPSDGRGADYILKWIADLLDEVVDMTNYQWMVWFDKLAYKLVVEQRKDLITTIDRKEYITISSPTAGDWSIQLRIAGVKGDFEDMLSDTIVDRITIEIDLDDGNDGFYP